ncbi:hypothetical protein VTI74DRAFT_774 [Chaetomium olivicolor]
MSSSARLGLRTRGLLSARVPAPGRISPLSVSLRVATQQRRNRSGPSRAALEHASPRVTTQMSPKTEMANRMMNNLNEISAEALSVVVPGTFVLPPFSQFPKSLSEKLRFLYYWAIIKAQEVLTNAALTFSSKPTIFKRAQFKPKRSVLVPTAKALHRAMAEALASGDKSTINRVCSRKLANSLLATIDARPRGRRYGWELVKYTNKLSYPSVKSHRVSPISHERNAPIIRQAVVAISSRQRRVQYDAQGQVVPGSEKEIDAVENVAIASIIDPRTWTQGEWRLIGTIKSTTLDEWMVEKELLKQMLKER